MDDAEMTPTDHMHVAIFRVMMETLGHSPPVTREDIASLESAVPDVNWRHWVGCLVGDMTVGR